MKAKDLRERTTEHLKELEKQLPGEVFQARFKNFTNRLNDTASIRKTRRDLARIKTILTQRAWLAGETARWREKKAQRMAMAKAEARRTKAAAKAARCAEVRRLRRSPARRPEPPSATASAASWSAA